MREVWGAHAYACECGVACIDVHHVCVLLLQSLFSLARRTHARTHACTHVTQAESVRGMTPAIVTLIKRKADLTTQDKEGNTLLHYAAGMDSIEVVKLLLNAKVDPAVPNRGGQVARERVSNGNRDLVELFDGPSNEACVAMRCDA